ncbi:hypothetical protein VPFG_00235 [Vibrio phage nt-1]|uniref:Uncharacterized protein n=1 Tax=Vibrio phage nt-1 TaxID=115992 RepID=R9TFI1_9CAUD|nr:hypothetical protein VPFG_00235 [Vibrio phage nt-1]AGN30234.1 hypothetical protein VPFG_00235 [Vibrio phage nt-1]
MTLEERLALLEQELSTTPPAQILAELKSYEPKGSLVDDFILETLIPTLAKSKAHELLADERMVTDMEVYTCNEINNFVIDALEIDDYDEAQAVRFYLQDQSKAFVESVVSDAESVVGFTPSDYALSELQVSLDNCRYQGAFIHVMVMNDYGYKDETKFPSARTAWLKFILENA